MKAAQQTELKAAREKKRNDSRSFVAQGVPFSTVCPNCKQVDSVQKVSSVVSGGTSRGSASGSTSSTVFTSGGGFGGTLGQANFRVENQTRLARYLEKPYIWYDLTGGGGPASREKFVDDRQCNGCWDKFFYCHRCDGVFLPRHPELGIRSAEGLKDTVMWLVKKYDDVVWWGEELELFR